MTAFQIQRPQYSDPRPGVVDFNWGEAYWCKVPAGKFIYGGDKASNPRRKIKIPYDYWMGKYLVTYAQWQAFVEDADGYRNPRWWEGLHEEGQEQQRRGPGEQYRKIANHPAESVSWYEAMAFCGWLNEARRQGVLTLPAFIPADYEIRLPTEQEWEKAARGTDGRQYPWGDDYRAGFANIDETWVSDRSYYVGMTTAVGIYPQGASPYGLLDMAGNVWEWCRTEYSTEDDKNIGSSDLRALRGGSWVLQAVYARALFRLWSYPGLRSGSFGFRLGCSAPIRSLRSLRSLILGISGGFRGA
jgi:formylglycine-generating enzyme required for sulfatase activity